MHLSKKKRMTKEETILFVFCFSHPQHYVRIPRFVFCVLQKKKNQHCPVSKLKLGLSNKRCSCARFRCPAKFARFISLLCLCSLVWLTFCHLPLHPFRFPRPPCIPSPSLLTRMLVVMCFSSFSPTTYFPFSDATPLLSCAANNCSSYAPPRINILAKRTE